MNDWEHGPHDEEVGPEPPLGWLDILYGTLFQPRATFRRLVDRPPYLLAVAVFAVAGIVSAALARHLGPLFLSELESLQGLPEMGIDLARLTGAISIMAFWLGLFGWIFIAGLFHLVAGLLGGRGSAGALFAFLGLAHLPSIFGAPLGALELNTGLSLLSSFGFVLDFWRYYLYYRAIRATYDLSRGRSLAVLLSPLAMAIVFFVAIAVLLLAFGTFASAIGLSSI